MASRRRARQYALQALYNADVRGLEAMPALQALWSGMLEEEGLSDDERPPKPSEMEFAQRLVEGTRTHVEAIDALIVTCSTNWRITRMPLVDRNILRMAGFELMECQDIPATVSVNEAIELAKHFGTADSRAFVNGIVDRMGRQLNRLKKRNR